MEKNFVEDAILKKKHISNIPSINEQRWSSFETCRVNKRVVLFGVSPLAWCYFERYGNCVGVDIVIDNDLKKQKHCLEDYFCCTKQDIKKRTRIQPISVLRDYDAEELVVLVASTNYYIDIIKQLEENGITNNFSILSMEANERIEFGQFSLDLAKKREFAEEICKTESIQKKKIVFKSFGNYADHEKYISKALYALRKDIDIVWIVSDLDADTPDYIRKVVVSNWKQYIYEMETAAMWVLDLEVPSYIQKRTDQFYIQTKHWASITLKKFYLDAITFESVPERIENWKRDGQMIDYIIAGSDFDVESCKRGFGFDGPFIMAGSPRTDGVFLRGENRRKVYSYFGIDDNVNILLYAPTYRFDKELGKNYAVATSLGFDFSRIKVALERRFGGEWAFMLRLHPSVSRAWERIEKPSYVYDASRYEDSQELVAASDIMISDFSSIMFEPAFAKKKVILFAPDLDDYLKNEYELLLDYRSLPFPIAESREQLEQCILDFDEVAYAHNLDLFFEKYGVHEDGHASERAAQFLSDIIDGKEV